MHVFGIHFWDWGADLDVMSWRTGWDVEANLASGSPNVGGRYAPACAEGFTIIQRLDYNWEDTVPVNPAEYAAFASDCANHWAANLKPYCRHYVIGNEMELWGSPSPQQYAELFTQVRDAIKAVQPEARVIIGHWTNSGNLIATMNWLGTEGFDGVCTHTGSTVPTDLLDDLDAFGAPADVGVYITEWGWVAGTNPNASSVMRSFYNGIGNSNASRTRQIYCACWYLYPSWLGVTFSLESSPIDNAAFEACTALGTAQNSYSAHPVLTSQARVEVSTSNADLTARWHTNIPSRTQLWYWKPGWNNGEFRPLDSTLVYDHTGYMSGDPVHILPQTEYTVMWRSTADNRGDGHVGPLKVTTGPWTISVSGVTGSSATISWQTLFPSSSRVEYGTTTAYGSSLSDASLVTNHVVTIGGLSPLTTYHYRVWSEATGYVPHHSGDRSFTSTGVPQTPAGFCQPGWNLTSVPIAPTNPEASAVFQDLIDLGNVIDNNLYRYEAGVGYDIYPLAFSNIDRGRGYWLWVSTADQNTVVSVAGQAATGDVVLPLAQGWNLIGHPQLQAVALSDCLVTDGVITRAFQDAVLAGWVGGSLYYWDPDAGYRVLSASGYGQDTALRPWRGYWLSAPAPGLSLIVPLG